MLPAYSRHACRCLPLARPLPYEIGGAAAARRHLLTCPPLTPLAPTPASVPPAGFSLDDPNTFAGRIYRMVKLGLSIDEEAGEAGAADDDLPELEENVDEGSRMEEVGAARGGCLCVLYCVCACVRVCLSVCVGRWGWSGCSVRQGRCPPAACKVRASPHAAGTGKVMEFLTCLLGTIFVQVD